MDERIVTVIGPDNGVAPGFMPESQWNDMKRAYEIELRSDQWTTTQPTEPGVYWALAGNHVIAVIVEEPEWDEGEGVRWSVIGAREPSHWLGPLPVPEPPHD